MKIIRLRKLMVSLALASAPLASVAIAEPVVDEAQVADEQVVTRADQQVIAGLSLGNELEIAVARLAVAKASTPVVRNYARQLLADHQQARVSIQRLALARRVNVNFVLRQMPQAASLRQQHLQTMSLLRRLQGRAFDQAFMRAAIQDHSSMLEWLRTRRSTVNDRQLVSYVDVIIPRLRRHVAEAQLVLARFTR